MQLLLADDDARLRSLVAACACETIGEIAILEAADGAEAMQLALQRRPEIALLDVRMRRLGGIDAAVILRHLQPRLRIAVQAADPAEHRERARAYRLPLFDKLKLERTLAWVEAQARADPPRSLVCSVCGYGIVRSEPPERCPMCQTERAWRSANLSAGR